MRGKIAALWGLYYLILDFPSFHHSTIPPFHPMLALGSAAYFIPSFLVFKKRAVVQLKTTAHLITQLITNKEKTRLYFVAVQLTKLPHSNNQSRFIFCVKMLNQELQSSRVLQVREQPNTSSSYRRILAKPLDLP